mgnify:FL=1
MIGSPTETNIVIKRLASILLIILSLNLFSLNMGYGSPTYMRVCGLLCLVALLIIYMNSYNKIHIKSISLAGAFLILLSFAVLTSIDKPQFWILSLIIFICGFDLLLRSAGECEPQLSALALGSLFYSIFYLYYINDPSFWRFFTSSSQAVSEVLGRIAGAPILLGPTINSAFIFLSFFCCAISFFILSENRSRRSIKALIVVEMSFALLYAAYLLTLVSVWTEADRYMDHAYLVFFVLLIPFLIFASKIGVRSLDLGYRVHSPGEGAVSASLVFSVFFAILLIAIVPFFGPNFNSGEIGKVVLYEKDSEMGFDIPHFPNANQSFAPDDGFSAGAIKRYLENMGALVESLNSTDSRDVKDALKDADILILMNLKKEFSSSGE